MLEMWDDIVLFFIFSALHISIFLTSPLSISIILFSVVVNDTIVLPAK